MWFKIIIRIIVTKSRRIYSCLLQETNLKALRLFKYADDTTLLVPQHTDTELQQEFNTSDPGPPTIV